ncbi:hypothetical protein CEQ90_08575 [Lewinellaceae bacterium SD302]|nr:hypothetical protein CEQ90_08575 [Lewinellaceae bacterium SD302]
MPIYFILTCDAPPNIDLSDPYSNNLHVFSSGYDTLLHVKLAITSIANVGDISFDDLTIASNMKYWCRNQYVDFDEVIYDGPIGAIQSQPGNEIGITYTFGNELINNNNYIFEVFAAATAESKFSDAFIYIDYNELGFQPNIASELSFIPGDLLLEGGNLYETFPFDFDENTLQFIIFSGGAPDPNQLTILSTTPKKVGTFTFPISSCDQEKEIKFNSETEVSDHTHYTGVMPVPYELYDPVKADDDLSGKICDCEDPEITMLSDLSINAGNGEVLVITGTDFGTYSFTDSKVMFRNGDDGGSSWMTAPRSSITENGIIQWSDDEIKVRVPSVGANSLITKPAASGFVRVENACGEDNSEDELNIPFAITNVKSSSTSGEPVKIGLSNLNENGICFTYGNLEGNDVPAWVKIEFANAISEWCNKTEIPLSVKQEEVEINGAAFNDGINSVTIENDLEVHAGAAVLFAGRTDGDGCNNGRVMTDIDIVISPSLIGSMPSSADEIDMRNKLKHEIGHVQMINHSVDLDAGSVPFQPIVYWSHTATAQGGQFVSIKPVDEEGANLIYQTSSDIVNTNCGGTPIEPSDNCNLICEDPNNTTIYQHESSKIEIYPNPISGTRLNLKVNGAELERDAQASISNIAGEVFPIYRRGINTFEMVTKPSPGLYVLKIYQYDATIVKKVIIQ